MEVYIFGDCIFFVARMFNVYFETDCENWVIMVRSLALWTKTLSFPTRNNPSTRQSKDKISSSILSPTPTKDKTPASTPDVSFFLLLWISMIFVSWNFFSSTLAFDEISGPSLWCSTYVSMWTFLMRNYYKPLLQIMIEGCFSKTWFIFFYRF